MKRILVLTAFLGILLAGAIPAFAQAPTLLVSGHGIAQNPPDFAGDVVNLQINCSTPCTGNDIGTLVIRNGGSVEFDGTITSATAVSKNEVVLTGFVPTSAFNAIATKTGSNTWTLFIEGALIFEGGPTFEINGNLQITTPPQS